MNRLSKILTLFVLAIAMASVQSVVAQGTKEQLAAYYYQNGEYEKALELYEPLYAQYPNPYYYQVLYQTYVSLGKLKEAERLVEKRIKQNPNQLTLYVDLGELYVKKGDSKKAVKLFDEVVEKPGFDTKQVNDLASALANAGHVDYAIKTYLASRKKTRNNFLYVMELAAMYQRKGDYEAMMQEYFDLLDATPGQMGSIQISLQRALTETSNPQLAEGLRKTLVSRVQKHPENTQYLEMMIWFSLQQKDFDFALTQAKAVDARFPDDGGSQVFRVAQIAENNGDLVRAEDGYSYIVNKGRDGAYYFEARVRLLSVQFERLNANYAVSEGDLRAIVGRYESALAELGKNANTVPLMRQYAHLLAYHANELQKAVDLLYDVVEMRGLQPQVLAETKLDLGDLLLFAGEIWDASLLYSQVEKAYKNDVVGALAKFKNAKLSYYNKDFTWAKSQLDVLRASTSKLIANDAMELSLLISDNMEEDSTFDMLEMYAEADLMMLRNRLDEAWEGFDAITKRTLSHPLFDEVLMQKAKIRMKQGRYEEADSLLQKLVEFYPEDLTADDALYMRAQLNDDQLNDKTKARECYEKLILDYPMSLYVDFARRRYNELK